jgi:hypothetical protein
MEFFKHPLCNFEFTAPPGTEKECDSLPVQTWKDPTFGPCSTSFWRPNQEELAALVAGGSIALNIFATGHPVVSMGVYRKEHKNV